MKKAVHGDTFQDEKTSATIMDGERIGIEVRVGQVFKRRKCKSPGLWIWWQDKYMVSELKGPALVSKEIWESLKKYVDRKFRDFERRCK